jgi:hypothetical protein
MLERDHATHIGALHDMVQAVEGDVLQTAAALSKSAAVDNFAKISEPASIKSRLKDLEHELELAPPPS